MEANTALMAYRADSPDISGGVLFFEALHPQINDPGLGLVVIGLYLLHIVYLLFTVGEFYHYGVGRVVIDTHNTLGTVEHW